MLIYEELTGVVCVSEVGSWAIRDLKVLKLIVGQTSRPARSPTLLMGMRRGH
jgi:hypothetical protein